MKKQNLLVYRKHIVLSASRIEDINKFLLEYCDSLKYSAITKEGSDLYFDSLDELLAFSNFKNDKITTIEIDGNGGKKGCLHIELAFSPKYPFQDTTAKCRYQFDDLDNEHLFHDGIQRKLDMVTEAQKSYVFSQYISLIIMFMLAGLYFFKVSLFSEWTTITKIGCEVVFGALLYSSFKTHILNRLFPRVIFSIGEEIQHYESLKKWRSGLFWSVLVATVIGICISYYFSR